MIFALRRLLVLVFLIAPLSVQAAPDNSKDSGKGFRPFKAIGRALAGKNEENPRIRRTKDNSGGLFGSGSRRHRSRDIGEASSPRSWKEKRQDKKTERSTKIENLSKRDRDDEDDRDSGKGRVTKIAVNDRQGPAVIYHRFLSRNKNKDREVVVDISKQRAYVKIDGKVAIDTPVSTGRSGKSTPRGTYEITERIRRGKISTIYHAHLPNWMRLNWTSIGFHSGRVPGYPASAGCVRLPHNVASYVYDAVAAGTVVSIKR